MSYDTRDAPRRRVCGRLLDELGAPVGGAMIKPGHVEPDERTEQISAADGTFELRAVLTEELVLAVYLEDVPEEPWPPEWQQHARHAIDVAAGGDVDLGDVVLTPPATLDLRIVGRTGAVPKSGVVSIGIPGMWEWSGSAIQPDGSWRAGSVADRTWSVWVEVEDIDGIPLELDRHHVRPGEAIHELQVTGRGNLVARLHPKGQPDASLHVSEGRLWVDDRGGTQLGSISTLHATVHPGTTPHVRIDVPGFRPVDLGEVAISETDVTVLDVELDPDPDYIATDL